jgi:hypothetical protein
MEKKKYEGNLLILMIYYPVKYKYFITETKDDYLKFTIPKIRTVY